MNRREYVAFGIALLVLSGVLTFGLLRSVVGSQLATHLALWGGIVVVIVGSQKRSQQYIVAGVVFSTASLASVVVVTVDGQLRASETADFGDSIAVALASFHRDKGYYPDQLRELVPRYLNTIPSPRTRGTRGAQFYYTSREPDDYELGFRRQGLEYCWREASGDWACVSD
jgi:uncharacterized membrane protein (GlpM family)